MHILRKVHFSLKTFSTLKSDTQFFSENGHVFTLYTSTTLGVTTDSDWHFYYAFRTQEFWVIFV
jgi:hypothetical protein